MHKYIQTYICRHLLLLRRCVGGNKLVMHVRTHTHTRSRTRTHTHTHPHAPTPAHARKPTHTHACTHARTHMHTHARTHTHAHTRTHTDAHTHTHRPPLPPPPHTNTHTGSLAVTAGGNQLCVWDLVGGGRLLKKLSNFQKTVTAVRLSPMAGPDSMAAPRLLAGSLDGHVKVCVCV